MSLLQTPRTFAQPNREAKPLTVQRQSGAGAGSSFRNAFALVRFNTEAPQLFGTPPADITASEMTEAADRVSFTVNAVADPSIGKYTGNSGADNEIVHADAATVGRLIDLINGLDSGQFENGVPLRRYYARLADYHPRTTINATAGQVFAAATLLRGEYAPGLGITAAASSAANSPDYGANVALGFGTGAVDSAAFYPRWGRGSGSVVPEYLESGSAFPPPAVGDYTRGKAGSIARGNSEFGRSGFVQRTPVLSKEYNRFEDFEVFIESILCDVVFSTATRMYRIFDPAGNLVWSKLQNTTEVFPRVLVQGPAFIVVTGAVGTAATISTNGNLCAKGTVRMA